MLIKTDLREPSDLFAEFVAAEKLYRQEGIISQETVDAVQTVYHRARRLLLHIAADQGYLDDHLQEADQRLETLFPVPGIAGQNQTQTERKDPC